MQLCLTLMGIEYAYEDGLIEPLADEKKKNAKDILNNVNLVNFLISYIKDMKNETLHILISHETA